MTAIDFPEYLREPRTGLPRQARDLTHRDLGRFITCECVATSRRAVHAEIHSIIHDGATVLVLVGPHHAHIWLNPDTQVTIAGRNE